MEKSTLLNAIDSINSKRFACKVSDEIISEAEAQLSVKIAEDYKLILKHYGTLAMKGHEFLGIDSNRYDAVKATLRLREEDPTFPQDVYVIENMGIDGIFLVQKSNGEIYTYQHNASLQLVSPNFEALVKKL